MLKKSIYLVPLLCCAQLFFSCAGSSTAYQMDSTEKEKQKGYHANQANKIIDKNQQNRKVNQKTAEKNRQKTNKTAEENAKEKAKNSPSSKKHSSKYSFY